MPIITTIRGNLRPFGKRSIFMSESTGGTITTAGGYRIHTFTETGSSIFSPALGASVQYLIVGAGGGASGGYGGVWYGPGGASGVVRTGTTSVTAQNYTVNVGLGGSASVPSNRGTGGTGGTSSFNGINATGGTGSGEGPSGASNADYSGHGGAGDGRFASAGGGAGAGGNASGPRGGIGVYNSLSGTSVGYGGGGAGGSDGDGGDGANGPGDAPLYGGGCGRSSYSPQYQGIDGKGGGASGANSGVSFRGGHGIVIIRYPI